MSRSKVNHQKERHTIWVSSHAWNRMDNMALRAANGHESKKNVSEMFEAAAMAYKTNEQDIFAELKRVCAIKITAAQDEMKLLEQAEKAAILRKQKEAREEIDNVLKSKAVEASE